MLRSDELAISRLRKRNISIYVKGLGERPLFGVHGIGIVIKVCYASIIIAGVQHYHVCAVISEMPKVVIAAITHQIAFRSGKFARFAAGRRYLLGESVSTRNTLGRR